MEKAGETGVAMASGDGVVRRNHPIFAAHAGDYMEHIAIVGCKMGKCTICEVPPKTLVTLTSIHCMT